MDDHQAQRLNALLGELASDPAYASGKRKLATPITGDDADAIAAGFQDEVDKGVAARDAQIAAQGMKLACGRGCNGCCHEPIMIFRPEAVRIARWLKLPEQAEIRAAFLAAYPAWKAATGDTPATLSQLFTSDPDAYLAAHIAGWRKEVMCAFNQHGDCTIYPVRPINCRNGHAIGTSEHCNGAANTAAKRVNFVPLDSFIKRSRDLLQATHNAIGGPRGRVEALPNIVYHLLTRR